MLEGGGVSHLLKKFIFPFLFLCLVVYVFPFSGDSKVVDKKPTVDQIEKIEFSQDTFFVSDQADKVSISGACHASNQAGKIEWSLVKENSSLDKIVQGVTECKENQLKIEIDHLKPFDCDKKYKIHVSYKSLAILYETKVSLIKKCVPKRRLPSSVVTESQEGCFFELRSFESGEQCVESCYQKSLLINEKIVDRSRC